MVVNRSCRLQHTIPHIQWPSIRMMKNLYGGRKKEETKKSNRGGIPLPKSFAFPVAFAYFYSSANEMVLYILPYNCDKLNVYFTFWYWKNAQPFNMYTPDPKYTLYLYCKHLSFSFILELWSFIFLFLILISIRIIIIILYWVFYLWFL